MNFVYLLTNNSKESGTRFYVGCKQGAKVQDINGVKTIINVRDGRPYYSSSQSDLFIDDMLSGDVFEASILEIVSDRKEIYEREQVWLKKLNCVASDDYYNLNDRLLPVGDQDAICNTFGESYREYASRESSFSKRDNTAKRCGFDNFGDLYIYICEQSALKTMADISRELGCKRHFARSLVEKIDLQKAKTELVNCEDVKVELRKLLARGCSFYKACELLKLELPSARIMLGDFNKVGERAFTAAINQGLSKEELEVEVTKRVLSGLGVVEVANDLGLTKESCYRYFLRCVRKRLKASDL